MRALTTAFLMLALLGASHHAGAGTRSGALAVDAIRVSIAAQDCRQAVDRLTHAADAVTEDVVHMCEDMGIETGIDLDALIGCAALARDIVGRDLPSALLHAGPRTRKYAK